MFFSSADGFGVVRRVYDEADLLARVDFEDEDDLVCATMAYWTGSLAGPNYDPVFVFEIYLEDSEDFVCVRDALSTTRVGPQEFPVEVCEAQSIQGHRGLHGVVRLGRQTEEAVRCHIADVLEDVLLFEGLY